MPLSSKKFSKKPSFLSKLDPFTYVDEYAMPFLNPTKNEYVSWIVYIVFSFVFAYLLYSFFGFILNTASPLVIVVSGSMLPTMARGDVVILNGVTGPSLNVPEVVLSGIDVGNTSLVDLADLSSHSDGSWDILFKQTGQVVTVPQRGNGDIVVYLSSYKGLEIIHRAVAKIRVGDSYYLLTKGDNNPSLDQDCGPVFNDPFPGTDVSHLTTGKPCPSPYPVSLSDVKGKALFWIPYLGYVKLLLVDGLQGRFAP